MPPTPLRPPNEKIPKVPQSLTGAPLKKYTTLLRDFSHICLWYNIFMPPHPPNISVNFLKIPHKMRPYQAIFNWSIFNFFFPTKQQSHFFFTTLDFFFILKFWNHDFLNKKKGRWYFFLIVIFFSKNLIFKKCPLGNSLRKKNINI